MNRLNEVQNEIILTYQKENNNKQFIFLFTSDLKK